MKLEIKNADLSLKLKSLQISQLHQPNYTIIPVVTKAPILPLAQRSGSYVVID